VVEITRQHLRHALREREAVRMPHLEARREIERRRSLLHRAHDRLATVAGIHAPEASRPIEHTSSVDRRVVHTAGRREQSWCALEGSVGRERHPELLERELGPENVGDRRSFGHGQSSSS
jgi:hypothetical protein